MVSEYQHEYGVPVIDIAAALVAVAQGSGKPAAREAAVARHGDQSASPNDRPRDKSARSEIDFDSAVGLRGRTGSEAEDVPGPVPGGREQRRTATREKSHAADFGMERYRIEVGASHGVKPGNIVGAIANEAELDSEHIGRVEIFDHYSTVELPEGMPREIFRHLKKVWVSGQRLQISRIDSKPASAPKRGHDSQERRRTGKQHDKRRRRK
jgi:ATP-dependent RNA helicase DeaD